MKKIINGKAYNTETATIVGRVDIRRVKYGEPRPGPDGKNLMRLPSGSEKIGAETLYQTAGGAYFWAWEYDDPDHPGELKSCTRTQALNWAERHFKTDEIEKMFGPIPEAGTKAGTLLLRLPPGLKQHAEASAKGAEMSLNAWAMRCVERCVELPAIKMALASAWGIASGRIKSDADSHSVTLIDPMDFIKHQVEFVAGVLGWSDEDLSKFLAATWSTGTPSQGA